MVLLGALPARVRLLRSRRSRCIDLSEMFMPKKES
jgi:hypothetical protein